MKLTIINRSQWPDWFLQPVCEWIAARADIEWDYTLTIKGTQRTDTYGGRGAKFHGRAWYHRRCRVPIGPDHRFDWSTKVSIRGGIAAFVFLIAHEMYHATHGHPRKFMQGGRVNRDLMEFKCNQFGTRVVEEFSREWPAFVRLFLFRLRRDRKRAVASADRAAAKTAERGSSSYRLAQRREQLKRWESKAKRAQTAIRKLRRSVAMLEKRALTTPSAAGG